MNLAQEDEEEAPFLGSAASPKQVAMNQSQDFDTWEEINKDKTFFVLILLVSFQEGMAALSALALQYFLKDDLGQSPAQAQVASAVIMSPWMVKPFWGLLCDSLPIFGSRRRAYFFLACGINGMSWVAMGLWIKTIGLAVAVLTAGSAAMAFMSVLAKGLIVERSINSNQRFASWLQALFFGMKAGSGMIAAYFGGFLLDYVSKQQLFLYSCIIPFLTAAVATFLTEPDYPRQSMLQQLELIWDAITAVRTTGDGKVFYLWQPMLWMLMWRSMPSASSAMFYFWTNDLKFDYEFMGRLALIGSACSLIAMLFYQKYLSEIAYRKMLVSASLVAAGFNSLMIVLVTHYNRKLGIPDEWFCAGDEVLVLSARLCPPRIESTMYATMMACLNMGAVIAKATGSLVTDAFGITDTSFDKLWLLILVCNLASLVPLLRLHSLVPDVEASIATKEASPLPRNASASALDDDDDDEDEEEGYGSDGEGYGYGHGYGQGGYDGDGEEGEEGRAHPHRPRRSRSRPGSASTDSVVVPPPPLPLPPHTVHV